MKKYFFYFFSLCLAGAFLLAKDVNAEDYNFEKIFYLASYNAVKGVASVEQNWQKIDILSPQYQTVIFEGNNAKIVGKFGPKLKQVIKDRNLKVMPLITNAHFSQSLMHKLLTSPVQQDRVITGLVYLAKRDKYIGWQFDFENMSYKDRDLYSVFVEKTYKAFKKNNLILSVAVVSRTTDYENTDAFKNWGGVYDYARLSKSADFLSLMAYDDPNSKGPAASTEFVNGILAYVKDKIPASKLSLGVPLYYWKWDTDQNKKLGYGLFNNVINIIANFAHAKDFNPELGVSWLSYSYNSKNYKIWYEDKQSLGLKFDIIKQNGFRGFSAWLLGGEDSAIWTVL
jgi:spore germination protein YaaH